MILCFNDCSRRTKTIVQKRDCRASLAMTKLSNEAPTGSLRGAYATKHPLKGVRQEKKSLLCELQGFYTNLADGLPGCFFNSGASSPILHPYFRGKTVSDFAAPSTHRDQGWSTEQPLPPCGGPENLRYHAVSRRKVQSSGYKPAS